MNHIDNRQILASYPLLLRKGEVAKLAIPVEKSTLHIQFSLETSDDGGTRWELKGGDPGIFRIFNVTSGIAAGSNEPIVVAESANGNKVFVQFLVQAISGETKHLMLQFTLLKADG